MNKYSRFTFTTLVFWNIFDSETKHNTVLYELYTLLNQLLLSFFFFLFSVFSLTHLSSPLSPTRGKLDYRPAMRQCKRFKAYTGKKELLNVWKIYRQRNGNVGIEKCQVVFLNSGKELQLEFLVHFSSAWRLKTGLKYSPNNHSQVYITGNWPAEIHLWSAIGNLLKKRERNSLPNMGRFKTDFTFCHIVPLPSYKSKSVFCRKKKITNQPAH